MNLNVMINIEKAIRKLAIIMNNEWKENKKILTAKKIVTIHFIFNVNYL